MSSSPGSRSYVPKQGTIGHGIVDIDGYFEFNGTSDPATVSGKGFSVAYTSTGTWTVTLDQAYLELTGASATVCMASAANVDLTVQFGAIDVVTAKTIVIRTMTGTSATTGATAAGNGVRFKLSLRRSRVTG